MSVIQCESTILALCFLLAHCRRNLHRRGRCKGARTVARSRRPCCSMRTPGTAARPAAAARTAQRSRRLALAVEPAAGCTHCWTTVPGAVCSHLDSRKVQAAAAAPAVLHKPPAAAVAGHPAHRHTLAAPMLLHLAAVAAAAVQAQLRCLTATLATASQHLPRQLVAAAAVLAASAGDSCGTFSVCQLQHVARHDRKWQRQHGHQGMRSHR